MLSEAGLRPLLLPLMLLLVALGPSPARAGPVNRQAGSPNNLRLDGRNQSHTEQSVCVNDDVLYQPGDPMPAPGPCSRCVCRPPTSFCEPVACDKKPGCKALQRPGQCCPEYQCECERDGRVYQNGERLEGAGGPCQACFCRGGEVVCTAVECYRRPDCEPQHVPGRCCPKYDHCPPLAMETAAAVDSSRSRAQFQPGATEAAADQDLGASNVAEERVHAVAVSAPEEPVVAAATHKQPGPKPEAAEPPFTPAAPSPDGLEPAMPAAEKPVPPAEVPSSSPVADVAPLSASTSLEPSSALPSSPAQPPASSAPTEAATTHPEPNPATSPEGVPAIRIDVPLVPWRGVENAVAATEKSATEATTAGSGSAETGATERIEAETETEAVTEGSGELDTATDLTTAQDSIDETATEAPASVDPSEVPQGDGPALRSPVAAAEQKTKDATEILPSEESDESATTAAYEHTEMLDEMSTTSEPEEETSSTDEPQSTEAPEATGQPHKVPDFSTEVAFDSSEAPLTSESSTDSSPEYKELDELPGYKSGELQRDGASRPASAVSASGPGSSSGSSASSGSGSSESASQVLATNVQAETVPLPASNSGLDSSVGSGSGSSFALSEPSSADSTESSESTELPETTESLLSSSEEPSETSHSKKASSNKSKPEDDLDKVKDDDKINIVLDTETTDEGGPPILLIGDDLANHQMDIVMATAPAESGSDASTEIPDSRDSEPGSVPPSTVEQDGTTEAGITPGEDIVLSDEPLPGQAASADGPLPGETLADSPGHLRSKPAAEGGESREEQTTFQEVQDAAAATTEGSGEIRTEAPEREAVTNGVTEVAASDEPDTESVSGDATALPVPESVGQKLLPQTEAELEESTGQPATTDSRQETNSGEEAQGHYTTTSAPEDSETPALPEALLKSNIPKEEAAPADQLSGDIAPIASTTLEPEAATSRSEVAEIEQNDSPATEIRHSDTTDRENSATTEQPDRETTVEEEVSTQDPLANSPSTKQQLIGEDLMLGDQPLSVLRSEGSAESNSEPPATEVEAYGTTEGAETQTAIQETDSTTSAPLANVSAEESNPKINPDVLEFKPSSPADAKPSNVTEAPLADADGTTLSPEWLKAENATEAPAAAAAAATATATATATAAPAHEFPAAGHGALARFASPDEVGKKDLFILEDFFTKLYRHQIATDDTKH